MTTASSNQRLHSSPDARSPPSSFAVLKPFSHTQQRLEQSRVEASVTFSPLSFNPHKTQSYNSTTLNSLEEETDQSLH